MDKSYFKDTTYFLLIIVTIVAVARGAPSGHGTSGNQGPFHKGFHGPHWTYAGSDNWHADHRDCGGHFQSPINIDPTTAIRENYPRLFFGNYDKVAAENITNNGHTVLLHLPINYPISQLPYITGGGMKDRYNFVQLHFHWGGDSSRGSEHLIAFKRFVGELHIVHYNDRYRSMIDASQHSDGLAVLAILIEMGPKDNEVFNHIVEHFPQILIDGQETNLISPIPIGQILPVNTNDFYRYKGSLTTPGCQEVVEWIILHTPIFISERQLNRFRQLFDSEGHILKDNYRPVHLKHGRIVTYRSENGMPLGQPLSAQIVQQRPQQQQNQNINQQNNNNRPGHLVFPSETSMESQEDFI